ncbi:hypothetical protein H4582DRAFT_1831295, partial [Lactarius indigo]
PLGYLNPWLYVNSFVVLNDITSGSNPGCNTDGFSAIAVWDPASPTRRRLAFDVEPRKSRVSKRTDEGI